MKTVAVVTLIALVLCCAVPLASASLCEFTEGGFYLRKDVLSCFYSVPFSESVRIQTLDTLNKTKELYAFVDIVHDSPDQESSRGLVESNILMTLISMMTCAHCTFAWAMHTLSITHLFAIAIS